MAGSWLELSVTCDHEAAESVSELLARYGYGSGVVSEPAFVSGRDGPEYAIDMTQPVTLRTYLPLDEQSPAIREQIAQALWHLGQMRPVGGLQTRELAEDDWANAWKQYYHVQRIGQRVVIVPSWLQYQAQPADVVLRLDPGMAFGTGLHPTTQLCLKLLEQLELQHRQALDLGCGSGILAIAAARMGATEVLAVDNDRIAVDAARENVLRNEVPVQVLEGSLGAGARMGHWLSGDFGDDSESESPATGMLVTRNQAGQITLERRSFDLILANLVARVLVTLAPDLAAALAPGGHLISSGIIIDREDEVALAFLAAGLQPLERHVEGEWVALIHTR